MLAEPTADAMEFIRRHAPKGVCEIGAGTGHWLEAMMRARIPCIGYDRAPRGPLVAMGDHLTAARHGDLTLLVVWPPDGPGVSEWFTAWRGNSAIICAAWGRIIFDTPGWEAGDTLTIPPGHKGGSIMKALSRA